MGFQQQYFDLDPDGPPPLSVITKRRVRFEEIDMLGIVWHGRYASYMEDGRVAFGDRYGLSYKNFKEAAIAAPIVQMHIDYRAPLYFDDTFQIKVNLHWCSSLRLNFEYVITKEEQLIAKGYTVQLLTEVSGDVLLMPPDMVREFRTRWQEGSI